jgi:hypothetical protein
MLGICTPQVRLKHRPLAAMLSRRKNMDEKKKSSMVDQMMAAMARKNSQHHPEIKNPDGTVKATKPRRGTGPVPKPMKKVTGRGR